MREMLKKIIIVLVKKHILEVKKVFISSPEQKFFDENHCIGCSMGYGPKYSVMHRRILFWKVGQPKYREIMTFVY